MAGKIKPEKYHLQSGGTQFKFVMFYLHCSFYVRRVENIATKNNVGCFSSEQWLKHAETSNFGI